MLARFFWSKPWKRLSGNFPATCAARLAGGHSVHASAMGVHRTGSTLAGEQRAAHAVCVGAEIIEVASGDRQC